MFYFEKEFGNDIDGLQPEFVKKYEIPLERPLVLPGGRKWRNPKDAFNEDFIAEIISSQAELINGSTLG